MKRLMNKASSEIIDGVGSGDFDPRDKDASLFLFSGLEEVRQRVLSAFGGRTITFGEIVDKEIASTTYTDSNYRDALLELEGEGRVTMEPPAEKRPLQAGGLKRTLSTKTRIKFPK